MKRLKIWWVAVWENAVPMVVLLAFAVGGCGSVAVEGETAAARTKIALIAEGCAGNGLVVTRRTVTDSIAEAGFVPLVLPNVSCINGMDDVLDRADALVIFGSLKGELPVRKEFEKRLIRRAAERGIPVVGFCHGHQVINWAFGGKIGRNPTNVAVRVVHHGKENPYVKDCFHKIMVESGSLVAKGLGEGEQTVNSSHNYCITELAPDFMVTAVAEDGVIEAIEHKSLPVFGFQFHPERIAFNTHDPHFVKLIRCALTGNAGGR